MPISQVPFAGISNPVDFRNIVINGDMQIAQRSTSVASITTEGYYTIDRFKFIPSSMGTWTMSQSTDVPSGYGFANSLKLDCTTADASPSAADVLLIQTKFEGQNLQYLKKGTANALPLTLSFWVKSTKTGTFIAELYDEDNTRQISKSYTVSVTNTWEFKTITFPGDTTGALDNDNASSLNLNLWLGTGSNHSSGTLNTSWASSTTANRAVGQVNIADSTSNDWLITGVQLEAGEQASGFEFMPIDIDLGRCQRYCSRFGDGLSGIATDTSRIFLMVFFPIPMRASPSAVLTDTTINATDNFTADYLSSSSTVTSVDVNAFGGRFLLSGYGGALTQGRVYAAYGNTNGHFILFSAEL